MIANVDFARGEMYYKLSPNSLSPNSQGIYANTKEINEEVICKLRFVKQF